MTTIATSPPTSTDPTGSALSSMEKTIIDVVAEVLKVTDPAKVVALETQVPIAIQGGIALVKIIETLIGRRAVVVPTTPAPSATGGSS